MAIRIYRSDDEGRSWSYLSEIRAAKPGGIWEPEFTVGSDGALILFFSDATDPAAHSQTIKKVRTDNGLNWRDMGYVVASAIRRDRPGMAVTRRLADGQWIMTYELGGLAGCGKMQELCHSGARAPPASPETRNTDQRNQSLGLCSWVPGPALTGRPGMTREFFSILLAHFIVYYRLSDDGWDWGSPTTSIRKYVCRTAPSPLMRPGSPSCPAARSCSWPN